MSKPFPFEITSIFRRRRIHEIIDDNTETRIRLQGLHLSLCLLSSLFTAPQKKRNKRELHLSMRLIWHLHVISNLGYNNKSFLALFLTSKIEIAIIWLFIFLYTMRSFISVEIVEINLELTYITFYLFFFSFTTA